MVWNHRKLVEDQVMGYETTNQKPFSWVQEWIERLRIEVLRFIGFGFVG